MISTSICWMLHVRCRGGRSHKSTTTRPTATSIPTTPSCRTSSSTTSILSVRQCSRCSSGLAEANCRCETPVLSVGILVSGDGVLRSRQRSSERSLGVSAPGRGPTPGAGWGDLAAFRRPGKLVGTTDATGAYSPAPATDEWGRTADPAPGRLGPWGSHLRFVADGRTGIVRMGVRLYDPGAGRFLQVDPVEGGSATTTTTPAPSR
jgi:hypothetical protein